MKVRKIITAITIFVILFTIITPTIVLATEEIKKDTNEVTENKIESEEENKNNTSKETTENNEKINENVEENSIEETVENKNSNKQVDNSIQMQNITNAETLNEVNVRYNTHIEEYGWEEDFSKTDGETSGTTGQSKRIEAIKIKLENTKEILENVHIKYQVHVQDYGWMDWKQDGDTAGTTGESKRIEAIKIKLEGMEGNSVVYRTFVQDIGWTNWTSNGEISGTEGQSKRVEAIEIKIVKGQYEAFSVNTKNIKEYIKNNIHYLFLTSNIDTSNLIVNYTGNITSISRGTINKEEKTFTVDFSENEEVSVWANGENYIIKVMKSDLPCMNISLKGVTLEQINAGSKEIKYKNNEVNFTTADGTGDFSDNKMEIKGRGNTSWWEMSKKGYQIKLDKKVNILGMGKSKTWLLIANCEDCSLMRNKLIYDFAQEIGLEYTQNSKWIDLWVDGKYQGNYLLMEKVQVSDNRVELKEEDGLLLEVDNLFYGEELNSFVGNKSHSHYVLKDSVADDEGQEGSKAENAFKEIESYINQIEDILYSDTKDWDKIQSLIDVDSFVKHYLMLEFAEDPDGYRTSTYMYRDGKNDTLHMGPVWDFDKAVGNFKEDEVGGNPNIDYIITKDSVNYWGWYNKLFYYPQFRERIIYIYNNEFSSKMNMLNDKIEQYKNELQTSANMNFIYWDVLGKGNAFGDSRGHKIGKTFNEEVQYLNKWVEQRINYFNKRYSSDSGIIKIKYSSHIQNYGWESELSKCDGEISGTIGQSKRLEAITINLDTFNQELLENLSVKYQVHVEDYDWMDWKEDGELAGTTGESKRIEAIRIMLNDTSDYTVMYRVHVQDYGWMDWKKNGEIAGTTGQSKRVEAIQIKLVKTAQISVDYEYDETSNITEATITSQKKIARIDNGWQIDSDKLICTNKYNKNGTYKVGITFEDDDYTEVEIKITQIKNKIKYNSHIQYNGWEEEASKVDGELSGTVGESKRVEAIKISLGNDTSIPENAHIKYRVHVEGDGWLNWQKDGEMAGTERQSKRVEAIEIKLEGLDNYTVEYRVHVQDYGWMDWMIDGETAGTTGQSKRVEAVQIRIVDKYHRDYKGIDVSELNGTIDWQSVKNSGIQFTMIRCGYRGYRTGRIFKDSRFDENIQGASNVGIDVGIYFFSQATSIAEAIEEAEYAVNLANTYNCVKYPLAIDTEMSGADNDDGRADGLDSVIRTRVVASFCNRVNELGYKPMFYASRNWIYDRLEIARLSSYETWLAHYTYDKQSKSNYIYDYTMWQYSDEGSVPGIDGAVDLNVGYKKY